MLLIDHLIQQRADAEVEGGVVGVEEAEAGVEEAGGFVAGELDDLDVDAGWAIFCRLLSADGASHTMLRGQVL